jgi:hypothetical protein
MHDAAAGAGNLRIHGEGKHAERCIQKTRTLDAQPGAENTFQMMRYSDSDSDILVIYLVSACWRPDLIAHGIPTGA